MGNRARALVCSILIAASPAHAAQPLQSGYIIRFPQDEAAHPEFQTEWWYVTGWLQEGSDTPIGFQITFFRARNPGADANPSRFAARQLLFAHAALSLPREQRLLTAERSARIGFGLADASASTLDTSIDDWKLRATGDGYSVSSRSQEFALSLQLRPTQDPLLHGDAGFSRKSPDASAASYYYSLPHLAVKGSVTVRGRSIDVTGTAWFDHEWSNGYVDAKAVGWDWVGLNMSDGSSIMAFRMRTATGATLWSSATRRDRTGRQTAPSVEWQPLEWWQSPRTGVRFPVRWQIRVESQPYSIVPLMNDQENDARGSVGILYWEGAVEVRDASARRIGRGYLELTGYGERVRL